MRYMTATCLSRLSLWEFAEQVGHFLRHVCPGALLRPTNSNQPKLVRVPPASLHLLEKLGVATAFALIDDELACEPHAIPQQLLIPSGRGLKLFDLCPTYGNDESDTGSHPGSLVRRSRARSFDSDSESEDGSQDFSTSLRKKLRGRSIRHHRFRVSVDENTVTTSNSLYEVQFEDPSWWQYLPSLKCIGLACLMRDQRISDDGPTAEPHYTKVPLQNRNVEAVKSALVRSVCRERHDKQLGSLAQCIGFSTSPNRNGQKGDISAFEVQKSMHILSSSLVQQRLVRDAHERSIEQSRWWGIIRPDSTSVVVRDRRTEAYQLLTIGDPSVVIDLCQEAWQGEISTILPLGPMDRQTIVETTNNWKLADLDVSAFSFSPVPRSLESTLALNPNRDVCDYKYRRARFFVKSLWRLTFVVTDLSPRPCCSR